MQNPQHQATISDKNAVPTAASSMNPSMLVSSGIVTCGVLFLTAVYIFLNPFPHVTALKSITFFTLIGFAIISILLEEKRGFFRSPLFWPLFLVFLWALCTSFVAFNKANTIHDLYAHLLRYYAVYFLLTGYFVSRNLITMLSRTVILSAAVFCIWAIVFYYFYLGYSIEQKLGVDVFKEIPTNTIGIVLLFATVLALQYLQQERGKLARLTLLLAITTMVFTMLLTQTRGTIIAFLFVMFLLSFRHKWTLAIAVFMIGFALFLPVKYQFSPAGIIEKIQTDERLKIALFYTEIIKDYPLQGIGFGMESYADEKFLQSYQDRLDPSRRTTILFKAPHNFFVDIAVRLGLIGLAIYIYLLLKTFGMIHDLMKSSDRYYKDWGWIFLCCLTAFMIQSMFENVNSGPPAIVLYTQLAMITIVWKLARTEVASLRVATSSR